MPVDRWLPDFPNYANAPAVEEVGSDISAEAFHRDFVLRHRPCVIRAAASSWPAISKWNVEHLRRTLGDQMLGRDNSGVLYEPLVEYSPSRVLSRPNVMTLAQFLDEVVSLKRPRVQAYAEHSTRLADVREDLGEFAFLHPADHPPREYADRYFMSRAGYTDWHVHIGDETLTTQLLGTKEFLLLPPDNGTFTTMVAMAKRGVWKTPPACWDEDFRHMQPWRTVLAPGDVVYIPMHWWHATEAQGDELNITYARVFATPARWLADLRMANVRFSLRINLALGLMSGLRQRRPRPVLRAGYNVARAIVWFPAALWHNRAAMRWPTMIPDPAATLTSS